MGWNLSDRQFLGNLVHGGPCVQEISRNWDFIRNPPVRWFPMVPSPSSSGHQGRALSLSSRWFRARETHLCHTMGELMILDLSGTSKRFLPDKSSIISCDKDFWISHGNPEVEPWRTLKWNTVPSQRLTSGFQGSGFLRNRLCHLASGDYTSHTLPRG